MSITTTEAYDEKVVGAAIVATPTGPGPLSGAKVGLFTNTPGLSKTMTLASFTEPTYTGYARVAATWVPAQRSNLGDICTQTQSIIFQQTGPPTGAVTIQGAFVVAADGTTLLAAGMLPGPYGLADVVDALNIIVRMTFNMNSDNGEVEVL